MDRFSTINVGRLDSLSGVGQSAGTKSPSLAGFLSQRANQVLGNRQVAAAVETQASDAAVPETPQDSVPLNPMLARQMDQMQRLHSSISLPGNYQGISVVV